MAKLDPCEIDEVRPIKVVVVGAGISGILAAIRFPRQIPNLDLVVYDKNPEVGGTWYENRYPGVACDIPAPVYQASFEPNPRWSKFYASGGEILQYWKDIVAKYGARKYMRLGHKVVEARFNEEEVKWHVKVENVSNGEIVNDTCDVLYGCIGALNDWKWPEIPGIDTFEGTLLHSAAWDDKWKPDNLSVAVIGSGSSAIQIVPALQPKVKRLENYVRGHAWISPPVAADEVRKHNPDLSNFEFTSDEHQEFIDNSEAYLAYRKRIDSEIHSMTKFTLRGESSDQAAAMFTEHMREKLKRRPEIFQQIMPSFSPGCRRLTPGPGYLEALCEDNVSFVAEEIIEITEHGLVTKDGTLHRLDAIICATGFDTSFAHRFPIYGRDGVDLSGKWMEYPDTYISLGTHGMPNFFVAHGPSSGLGVGSLVIVLERTCDYVCKVICKMQQDRVATIEPKQEACDAFKAFCEQWFRKTVFTLPCRSWYKRGTIDGPVTALWPGSALHFMKTLEKPRFEDYEYTYIDGNEAGWMGNGWTVADNGSEADKSQYLDSDNVEYPQVAILQN